MKGLLKNNFYTVCANARVFFGFMLLLGIFSAFLGLQSFLINYVIIGIVGFSINAVAVTKNDFISKWGKYKLTMPVKRSDIIKSYYVNQIIWLMIGILFAGIALVCAGGIDLLLITVLNDLLEPGIITALTGDAALIVCSVAAYGLSYLASVNIFNRKEY